MELESLHVQMALGVEMIIAIDSTVLGPALGGCRWQPYADASEARRVACALAGSMTRKAALAGLRLGGGKAVVAGDPSRRTPEQLRAFGDFVDGLGGRYITAADMGTGEEEMAIIREGTNHVVGLPVRLGGCGSPAPFTAEGVYLALDAALAHRDRSLSGVGVEAVRVAVQGVGEVGRALVDRLLERGARVIAADPRLDTVRSLPEQVEVVTPQEILTADCDVLAPCGPPGVIDEGVVERLRCAVICGAANNALASPSIGPLLHSRSILYVPDFLANAGGLIHLAVALEGGDADATRRRLSVIPENLERTLELVKAEGIEPAAAAEQLALAKLAEGGYAGDLG